ncbi:HAD hydrolase-like protein [Janibacter hoylei]|uniref:HAD hydrolase-like protein n=1 Tax=Janibacter hoylei TaxID=364298 RepID=UPI00368D931C
MSLADRTFAAVIFDNDGTLVDSTGSVERSWVRWAVEHGVDPYALVGHHGMPAAAIIASVAPHLDAAAALRRIEQLEVDDVEGVIALPGVHDALEALAHAPVAVATSATRDLATVRAVEASVGKVAGADEALVGVLVAVAVTGVQGLPDRRGLCLDLRVELDKCEHARVRGAARGVRGPDDGVLGQGAVEPAGHHQVVGPCSSSGADLRGCLAGSHTEVLEEEAVAVSQLLQILRRDREPCWVDTSEPGQCPAQRLYALPRQLLTFLLGQRAPGGVGVAADEPVADPEDEGDSRQHPRERRHETGQLIDERGQLGRLLGGRQVGPADHLDQERRAE